MKDDLKIEKLAANYIYWAKCKTYKGYASNDSEGDFGTWDDWFELLVKFGKELCEDVKDGCKTIKKS